MVENFVIVSRMGTEGPFWSLLCIPSVQFLEDDSHQRSFLAVLRARLYQAFEEPDWSKIKRATTIAKQVTIVPREDLTDDILVRSATLFSENYGI